jgi:hypothetical protein
MKRVKYILIGVLLIFQMLKFLSCNYKEENIWNPYETDDLRILDEKMTVSRVKEIEIVKNEEGYNDITIHALNGSKASFYSNSPCGGPGPAYQIVASIPRLGILFIDRTYWCHPGETTIIVSLKDGIYRELKSGVWDVNQFSISPNGSWLVISPNDCGIGMSTECNIEILDLKNSNNSLLQTKFFSDRVCAGKSVNWLSEKVFTTESPVQDEQDCQPIYFEYKNSQWAFNFE